MPKRNRVLIAFSFLCASVLAPLPCAGDAVPAFINHAKELSCITVEPSGETVSGIEQVSGSFSEEDRAAAAVSASYAVARSDTVDGVVFSLAVEKKTYQQTDSLRARYLIRNRTMATVLYDFTSSCQFELQVTGSRGGSYSLLENSDCRPQPTRMTLAPGAEKVMEFGPVHLAMNRGDSVAVRASMAGYPLSSVLMKVRYKAAAAAASGPVALEGARTNKPMVEFDREKKMLVIRIDHAQRLTISAFVLTGKKMNKLTTEKFFAPGTHMISFNNRKLADGVVIFKVEGAGFSESKTINLAR